MPLLNLDVRDGTLADQTPSRFEPNYEALLGDVRFENHVENRWLLAVLILRRMEDARALMEEIIALIDTELDGSATG